MEAACLWRGNALCCDVVKVKRCIVIVCAVVVMAVIAKVIYISNSTDVEIAAGVDPGFLKSEMGVFYADKEPDDGWIDSLE